jgi:hypothetical protein
MFARYGDAEGIEQTPEWSEHQTLQNTLLVELRRETVSPEELLMDVLQVSILATLGSEPTRMSPDTAELIVSDTKRRTAEHEARRITSVNLMN